MIDELPHAVPGNHELKVNNQTVTYDLFDIQCHGIGGVYCNLTAHSDVNVPVEILCGDTFQKSIIFLKKNTTSTVVLDASCNQAQLSVGDWSRTLNVTPVFYDQIFDVGPVQIEIYRDGQLVLNKTVNHHAVFPELEPGAYTIKILDSRNTTGLLLIGEEEPKKVSYAVAGLLTLLSMGLFFKG